MSETPNHDYNVPAKGDENWHQPLNENFEDLEVDIEIRDEGGPTEGNNDYEPTDGAKYLDTTNGIIYLGNGTDWNQAFDFSGGGGGGDTSLTGGDGIDPSSITDGDTLSVAWGDATSLDSNGDVSDFGSANDLDSAGNVTDFSGATDLDSAGGVDQLSGSVAGGQTLTDIAGTNLSIDSNGTLNASGGSGGGISGLSGGDGIDPSTIGDGDTLTVAWGDAASLDSSGDITDFSSAASLDSNGTVDAGRYLATSGGQVNFVGPAEWENAGETAANTASGTNATVAGGTGNSADSFADTVGGGDTNAASGGPSTIAGGTGNNATGEHAVVSGGANNDSLTLGSFIGGGARNEVDGNYATIGGGNNNLITADYATIAGGNPSDFNNEDATRNAVYDQYGTVGGGGNNQAGSDDGTANAEYATVPGGRNNTASGAYSTAIGRNATASEDGSFVVGDSSETEVTPGSTDEARFQTSLVSESFIETGFSYYFQGSSMLLNTFEDSDTGNDVFAVSVPGNYGVPITQMRVNEFGDVVVTGDFDVEGNKNFVEPVDTEEGEKEVVYTASEAAEARTEASGVAKVEEGRAVIELPDHFDWVTSDDEPLVVQTTPYASEPVQPQVTERSTDRIVIEDFAGVDEYEVAYTVKGTRAGHEDKQVVREPTATGPSPAPADDD